MVLFLEFTGNVFAMSMEFTDDLFAFHMKFLMRLKSLNVVLETANMFSAKPTMPGKNNTVCDFATIIRDVMSSMQRRF